MTKSELIKTVEEGLLLNVKIVPNSSKNDIIKEEEFIKIKVTAPPVENRANKALIEFLSKLLKVPKTSVEIVKGETSKEKKILIKIKDEVKIKEIVSVLKSEEGV